MNNSVSSSVVAYVGRPPAQGGLTYYTETAPVTVEDFAAAMFEQPEFQDVNAELSVKAQVNNIYNNLFGRDGLDNVPGEGLEF
jgi:hypothetical protein